jgi:hypothetical protein
MTFIAGFVAGVIACGLTTRALIAHPLDASPGDSAAKPTTPVAAPNTPSRPLYRSTSRELVSGYAENPVAMEAKIRGNPIEVTGIVHGVERDAGDIYVRLEGSNRFAHPAMELAKEQECGAAALLTGDSATLVCQAMHFSIDMLIGKECRLAHVVSRERVGDD